MTRLTFFKADAGGFPGIALDDRRILVLNPEWAPTAEFTIENRRQKKCLATAVLWCALSPR